MSKTIVFMKILAGAVIYSTANIISKFVYPVSQELAAIPPAETWFIFTSLFIAGFIYSVIIFFTIRNSRKSGIKMIVQLTAVITVILFFTVFVVLSLIHPSVLMSQELKIVHFFEITASMTLLWFYISKISIKN